MSNDRIMPPLPPVPQRPGAPTLGGARKVGVPATPISAPAALKMPPLPIPPMRVAAPIMPPPQPGVAPPRPQQPRPNAWTQRNSPSAGIVQKQYVDMRLQELGAQAGPDKRAALDQLEQILLSKLAPNAKQQIPTKELLRVYAALERNLQSADLTINFLCESWFHEENPFDTYTQMYERGVKNGNGARMELASNALNDADRRAEADNMVSFPTNWGTQQAPAQRGLRPGAQSATRIRTQMDTGPLARTAPGAKTFNASNPHFNPKSKQIFLGLNYGRRPHGSGINYGPSYFVMKSSLKERCIYYAGDTFMQLGQPGLNAATLQVAFKNLGAILGKSQPGDFMLRTAIFESCYEGRTQPDPLGPTAKFLLLEAHHFGPLVFREHVDYMVLSPQNFMEAGTMQSINWPVIVDNANRFAKKHGFKVYQTT